MLRHAPLPGLAQPPLALPRQRIGVMGGSFDPPHAGHLNVAETAMKRLGLDRLWWVVSPGNPLKATDGRPSQDERMAACRRLITNPRMEVTGFEAALGSPYTARTLAFLHRRYPGTFFVWVMGADNLAQFHRWQDWRGIAATTPIAVVDRPGWRLKALASPAAQALAASRRSEQQADALPNMPPPAWTMLTTRLSPLSSTALRQKPAGR
ncbi:MAG: nicotinate-nucleotide adenylyltransferase [Hyphomicrobium sp.]